jgi:hypothetical protein
MPALGGFEDVDVNDDRERDKERGVGAVGDGKATKGGWNGRLTWNMGRNGWEMWDGGRCW